MGLGHAPRTVTNGLVFAMDTGNTFKSWKGKPITNEAKNASNQIDWNIGNLTQAVSLSTVVNNEVYRISSSSATGLDFRIYFANATLVNGSAYTVSYKYKFISGGPIFRANDWCDTGITRVTTDIGNGVFYETATGTRATYDVTYRFLDCQISNNTVVEIWDLQLELGSVASPYSSARSRTTTQSVLDLVGNNTITVSNLNYDNSIPTIAGTDSFLAVTNAAQLRPANQLTIEYVIKGNSVNPNWAPIFGYGNGNHTVGNYLVWTDSGLNSLCRINNGGTVTEYRQYPGYNINNTSYQHMIFTMSIGDAIRSYRNGVAVGTTPALPAGGTFSYTATASPYQIGGLGLTWLSADIPILRFYNRALTAAEAKQNYNAIRGRFGI
jgi:hypothetical protein